MVQRQVRWSPRSMNDKFSIFEYWKNRNKSSVYSQKLDALFTKTAAILAHYPKSGVETNINSIFFKVVRSYKLYYRFSDNYIEIVTVWDMRRNPADLKLK